MSENGTKDQEMFAIEGQRILQQLHEQGIIDLDAPMRQLIDRLDTPGDVSGYQLTSTSIGSPTPDQWWVLVDYDEDDGNKRGRVLAGSDLKSVGLGHLGR